MYCNACGKVIAEDGRFCAYCGAVVGYPPVTKKLFRLRSRTIAGVCSGMAQHLGMDVTLMRLLWVIVTIMSGIVPGIVAYVIAWIIIPEEPVMLPAVASGHPATNP